jgi:anti-sigma factor RsiW
MRECHETNERDALPSLLHGQLSAEAAARVRAHLAGCAACAEEYALLERSARLFATATPRIDVAAIVAKLPAAPAAARPALTVSRGGLRAARMPRSALAAAASLVLVATLSFAALKGRVFGGGTSATDVAPDSAVPMATAPVAAVPVAMVGGAELGDLGSAELEALLAELERMEATVSADPVTMQRAVVNAPEEL